MAAIRGWMCYTDVLTPMDGATSQPVEIAATQPMTIMNFSCRPWLIVGLMAFCFSSFVASFFSSASLLASPSIVVVEDEFEDEKESGGSPKPVGLPGESFRLDGHEAFILWPEASVRKTPQPWIFYAPSLAAYPDTHERWMHEQFLKAGVAVAGVDVGEAYGSPKSRKVFDALYEELTTKRGFAAKPCLLGRSRGGLWVTAWACDHPKRFAGIAGIYPVFDFRTYPGLDKACSAYDLTALQLEERLDQFNPIARAKVLAENKLPVFIIHGDEDTVVPLEPNSMSLLRLYEKADAKSAIELQVVQGQGHNYWEGFFRSQKLVDFSIERAKKGAAEVR